MTTEAVLVLIVGGIVSLVSGLAIALFRFGLKRADQGLTDGLREVASLKTVLYGVNGYGGLVTDVAALEARVRDLELRDRDRRR